MAACEHSLQAALLATHVLSCASATTHGAQAGGAVRASTTATVHQPSAQQPPHLHSGSARFALIGVFPALRRSTVLFSTADSTHKPFAACDPVYVRDAVLSSVKTTLESIDSSDGTSKPADALVAAALSKAQCFVLRWGHKGDANSAQRHATRSRSCIVVISPQAPTAIVGCTPHSTKGKRDREEEGSSGHEEATEAAKTQLAMLMNVPMAAVVAEACRTNTQLYAVGRVAHNSIISGACDATGGCAAAHTAVLDLVAHYVLPAVGFGGTCPVVSKRRNSGHSGTMPSDSLGTYLLDAVCSQTGKLIYSHSVDETAQPKAGSGTHGLAVLCADCYSIMSPDASELEKHNCHS